MPNSANTPRRTLLLTGASRGIGHATVIRFSSAGWRVLTCSRHPFPEDCPWDAGPEDHIQVDLADHADTSKAALASLTREMASDFGRIGVRVNSIAPGEIDTSILSPGTEKIVEQQIPLHRLGTPDEVAKIIYVLCTETSSYVNGAEIHINGGQHV
jgi:NAD(P)-dependent dehydrogenase (short-subunit alcohol dehydrogenase family)